MESQVSLSAFAYLYSELVQYHQNRVDSISELERRLESSGYQVGLKVLELLSYRSKEVKNIGKDLIKTTPNFFFGLTPIFHGVALHCFLLSLLLLLFLL